MLGAVPATHRLERAREDLGGEVVGGVRVAAARARVPAYGLRVAAVQLLVGRVVARAHPADQLGVGRRQLDRWWQDTVLPSVALGRHLGCGQAAGLTALVTE